MTIPSSIFAAASSAAIGIFLIKITLLLSAATLGLFLARKTPPVLRHRFCLYMLGSLLIFPLVLFVLPSWEIPPGILPALEVSASSPQSATEHLTLLPATVVLLVWFAGMFVCLAWSIAGYLYAAYKISRAVECTDLAWLQEFADVAKQKALPQDRVSLKVAHVGSPLAWGLRSATILIPREALSWNPQKRRMVLLHELTHIERRDHLSLHFVSFVRALYWFHPLVWWLSNELRREQERACDEAVVSAGVSRTDYAELLLDSVRQLSSGVLFGCAIFQLRNLQAFRNRLQHILHNDVSTRVSRASRAVLPAFTILVMVLAVVQPGFSEEKVYRIGGDVEAPKLIKKVEPQYTKEASDAKTRGTVVMRVVITTDGKVQDIVIERALSSGLDQKAIEAVQQWKFKPGTLKGKPVPVAATIEVNFRLQ